MLLITGVAGVGLGLADRAVQSDPLGVFAAVVIVALAVMSIVVVLGVDAAVQLFRHRRDRV